MQVTITKLRQELFRLVDRALEGEPVQFSHKGVIFRIVPETAPDKLSRLTRQTVLAPIVPEREPEHVEAEWQRDWAELSRNGATEPGPGEGSSGPAPR
jgi:antitoxin (DNA-binding transcriptional repressor) of toxin-antitoxin stability system